MIKKLRSLINEYFPFDLRVKIELLSRRRDISNKEKQDEIIKLLREAKLENIVQLGAGTNRYAFKLDGFVIKVATDRDGKIDNLKEFKMAKRLYPYVTKIYEVSENGTLLVAEYIQPFISFYEMQQYSDKIKKILSKLSSVFMIGDVGITSKNYSNWGLRVGSDEPVCLDFAYVYEVTSDLFLCKNCNTGSVLVPTNDFTSLVCPNSACGKKYSFEDIRAKLSNESHSKEIGDLSLEGYLMDSPDKEVDLDPTKSGYLKTNNIKKEKKVKEEIVLDNFVMEHPPEFYINNKEEKMGNKNKEFAKWVMENNSIVIEANSRIIGSNESICVELDAPIQPFGVLDRNDRFIDHPVDSFTIDMGEGDSYEENDKENSEISDYKSNSDIDDNSISIEAQVNLNPINKVSISDPITIDKSLPPIDEDEDNISISSITEEQDEEIIVSEPNFEISTSEKDKYDEEDIDRYRNKLYAIVSWLSNKIDDYNKEISLYDEIRPDSLDKDTFYKLNQNAIFRAFINYFNFTIEEYTDRRNEIRNRFIRPLSITNEREIETLMFIGRFYEEYIRISDSSLSVGDMLEEFFIKNPKSKGIDPAYYNLFSERLKAKAEDHITYEMIDTIIEYIHGGWSCPSVYTSRIQQFLEVEDKVSIMDNQTLNSNDDNDFVINIDDEVYYEDDDEEDDCDDCDDHDDHGYENSVRVEIINNFSGTNSLVKITCKGIDNDTITIPLLGDLNLYSEDVPTVDNPWEWLKLFALPLFVFKTKEPEKWLKINEMEVEQEESRIVELRKTSDGESILGIYAIDGVFDITNGEKFIDNIKQLTMLNVFILRLSGTYLNSLAMDKLETYLVDEKIIIDGIGGFFDYEYVETDEDESEKSIAEEVELAISEISESTTEIDTKEIDEADEDDTSVNTEPVRKTDEELMRELNEAAYMALRPDVEKDVDDSNEDINEEDFKIDIVNNPDTIESEYDKYNDVIPTNFKHVDGVSFEPIRRNRG